MKFVKIAIALTVAVSLLVSPALTQEASAGLPKVSLKKVDDINLGLKTTTKGKAKYNSLVNKIITNAKKRKTTFEKIYYVHNALIERFGINQNLYLPEVGPLGTAYRTVVEGGGDPLGFAHLNYHILKKLGIKSEVVLTKEKDYAWNIVKYEGKYYNVDVYSDGEYDHVDFSSFMVSDRALNHFKRGITSTSKNIARDERFDYFLKAGNTIKFTDSTIYYVGGNIGDEDVNDIRSLSLTGKDKLLFHPHDEMFKVVRWKGFVYYAEHYYVRDKKTQQLLPRSRIMKISHDGKTKTKVQDGKSYDVRLGENGIEVHQSNGDIDYVNLK